jgi:rhodanese-related sulfurtransferase
MNQTLLVIAGLVLLFMLYNSTTYTPSAAKGCVGCTIISAPYKPTDHFTYDFLVDVRSEQEWLEGHVPNSIHIPIDRLVNELPVKIPNKNASLLLCCRRGIRASGAATIATKLGYTHVNYLEGKCTDLIP